MVAADAPADGTVPSAAFPGAGEMQELRVDIASGLRREERMVRQQVPGQQDLVDHAVHIPSLLTLPFDIDQVFVEETQQFTFEVREIRLVTRAQESQPGPADAVHVVPASAAADATPDRVIVRQVGFRPRADRIRVCPQLDQVEEAELVSLFIHNPAGFACGRGNVGLGASPHEQNVRAGAERIADGADHKAAASGPSTIGEVVRGQIQPARGRTGNQVSHDQQRPAAQTFGGRSIHQDRWPTAGLLLDDRRQFVRGFRQAGQIRADNTAARRDGIEYQRLEEGQR